MMGERLRNPQHGIILWDRRFGPDNVTGQGVGTTDSSYTERNPRPPGAVAIGDAEAVVSGQLDAAVEVEVLTSGLGGRASVMAEGLGYRSQAHPRAYTMLREGASGALITVVGAAVVPSTGYPVVAYGGPDVTARTRRWTGSDDAWGSEVTISVGAKCNQGVCIVALPEDNALVLIAYEGALFSPSTAWRSLDGGATWARYARNPIAAASKTLRRLIGARVGGSILVIGQPDDTSGDLFQWASNDNGVTFTLVEAATGLGRFVSVTRLLSGDGLVTFVDGSDQPRAVKLGSAWQPLSSAERVPVGSGMSDPRGMATWADVDGSIMAVTVEQTGEITFFESQDNGGTWVSQQTTINIGANAFPNNLTGLATTRGAMLVHSHKQPSAADREDSAEVLWLGGWDNMELQRGQAYSGVTGNIWVPWTLPVAGRWTAFGAGSNATTDGMQLVGQRRFDADPIPAENVMYTCDVSVPAGKGSTVANQIGAQIIAGAASNLYNVTLRLADVGWVLFDNNGTAILGSGAADLTERMQFAITYQGAEMFVHVRRPYAESWARFGPFTPALSTGTRMVRWGNLLSTGAPESSWWMSGWRRDIGGEEVYLSKAAWNGRTTPTRLPAVAGSAAVLSLRGGPAVNLQSATITPEAEYPLSAALPDRRLSPSAPWEATAETEQIITFDLGSRAWIGHAIGVMVSRANFRTAALELSLTGGAFATVATLDLATGFSAGLTFDRVGASVTPATGTAAAGRYLQENELAGGYVILDGTHARRILGNSAGGWVTSGTVVPVLTIELSGGEPTSGGIVIVAPGGCMVAMSGSVTSGRYWRLRIPAQLTPNGRIGAGAILMGRCVAMGAPPDWAWTEEARPNVVIERDSRGTPTVYEQGPVSRTWGWGWGDGTDLLDLREDANPDFVGRAGSLALTAAEDVAWAMRGHLETHQALPVVAMRDIGASGVTVTDPTMWLYAHLVSSVAPRGMLGEEGQTERVRVDSITFAEIV